MPGLIDAAKALSIDREVGPLEAGKLADVILVDLFRIAHDADEHAGVSRDVLRECGRCVHDDGRWKGRPRGLAREGFVRVGQRNNADGWPSADMLGFLSNNSGDCYAVHLRKR
ncbi:amidohydrolase family protein [Burkholderia sp. DN3021]|uniref:amidohydrolase family protein n=1 Tax=Burkholderia TaxID=32008 RepID=UPI001FC8AB40|nr:amidohydrolase family protein [Burkholderia pyrrocinia]